MFKKNTVLAQAVFAGVLIGCTALQTTHADDNNSSARESVDVVDHHEFGTSDLVDGATWLVRNFRHKMVDENRSVQQMRHAR